MGPFLLVWAFGFLALSVPVLRSSTSPDPDDHFHPVILLLFAAWPLLLVVLGVLYALLLVGEWCSKEDNS